MKDRTIKSSTMSQVLCSTIVLEFLYVFKIKLRDSIVSQRGLVVDSINSLVEEQVAMFLHVVGHNQRFRVVHQSFRRSIELVSRYFHLVFYAFGEPRDELIKPPSSSTHVKIQGSHKWNPVFKVTIGYLGSIILGFGSCFHTYVSSFILGLYWCH